MPRPTVPIREPPSKTETIWVEPWPVVDRLNAMNKAATRTNHEGHHKSQAEQYLAESRRILRELAAERRREERRRPARPNILSEVKAILQGA